MGELIVLNTKSLRHKDTEKPVQIDLLCLSGLVSWRLGNQYAYMKWEDYLSAVLILLCHLARVAQDSILVAGIEPT
jgi:hypothetical protein